MGTGKDGKVTTVNEKDDVRLDDILLQAHQSKPKVEKPPVSEDEVNAILQSLGLGGKASENVVRPSAQSDVTPQTISTPLPKQPQHVQFGASKSSIPAPRTVSPARIITAPVTTPVVEHESSTLELPSIKEFSDAQERRRAAIERAAAETALRRAAQQQRQNSYVLPGMKVSKENLGVEVDDRFRAFFQTSAAEENTVAEEAPPTRTKKRVRKRKSQKSTTPKNDVVFSDEDDTQTAAESDASQQTLFDIPPVRQTPAAPPIAWDGIDDAATAMPPPKTQQLAARKAQTAQQTPPAAPISKVPSDTFQLNRFDSEALQQPAPIPWDTLDMPKLSLDDTGDFEPHPIPVMQEDTGFEEAPPEVPTDTKGEYRELFVDMPIHDPLEDTVAQTPVYDIGAEDESISEEDEYNHLEDAPTVHAVLKNMRVTRLLRIFITALLSGVLLWLNFSAQMSKALPLPFLDPTQKPTVFLAVNLLLLLVAGMACLTTLGGGLMGLFGRPTVDSLSTLAVVASVIQVGAYLFKPEAFSPTATALTTPLAALLLLGNALGKWLHSLAVSKNFERVSSGYHHAAAFLVENRDLSRAVCRGLGEPEPLLLVSRPTELVRGFMRQSFSVNSSDVTARKLSYILLAGGVVCGVLSGIMTVDVFAGISGGVGTICLAAPLAATLLYALPALRLQREAGRVEAVVPGPSAVHNLGLCNTLLLNARDLFPPSAVQFHGMQTFEKQRVDLAILYTTSILYERCETLRDTFLKLIDNKKDILCKVDSLQSETGYGYSGWIDRHEVLVGGREMMRRHNINVPSRDYEAKYTRGGKRCIIYLSVGSKLYAMFVVSYSGVPQAQEVLDKLEESAIGVVLETDDFNVTQQLLNATYRVSPSFVKVLSQPESVMLSGQTEYMPESDGYMTHKGTIGSFVGGLHAAARAAGREQVANMVQFGALIFTLILCLVLSFTLGVENLNLLAMVLYQLAWCAVTMIAQLLKRK